VFLRLVPQSAANFHQILVDTVMNAPYSFFTGRDIGTIINRFSQDMTLIESQLPTGLLCSLIYFFWTLGSLALISLGSSWMALTIPAVFCALYCVQKVYLRTSRRLRVVELELRSPIYSQFMETLKGLSTIRTLGWEAQFTNSIIKKLDDFKFPTICSFAIKDGFSLCWI
jgi:ABC-type bacteriocin/lantibiotic exporter with double-glycine peptidase domain